MIIISTHGLVIKVNQSLVTLIMWLYINTNLKTGYAFNKDLLVVLLIIFVRGEYNNIVGYYLKLSTLFC